MANNFIQLHTRGKLLLTGEYFVLSGAMALAIPSRFGQRFELHLSDQVKTIKWESLNHEGQPWFKGQFSPQDFQYFEGSDPKTGERLQQILLAIQSLNPNFSGLSQLNLVRSQLEFPQLWGLGSSSTLIAALAHWAEVDPYQLLEITFGGSGYDLACALADQALFYQKRSQQGHAVHFNYAPPFEEQLYLVYLGQKQNSRDGIKRYRKQVVPTPMDIDYISSLSLEFAAAKNLLQLENIIQEHENFVAQHLELQKAKDLHFPDYWGAVKSLGAWGGDFVLATSNRPERETKEYFSQRGKDTILRFKDFLPLKK